MILINIETYKQKLYPLTNNDFAFSIRELSRHILHNLSPEEEVTNCVWYKNETNEAGKLTRGERVKYAIQKGLPDEFVKTFYKTNERISDITKTLNKYTHINPEIFDITETEVNKLTEKVLDSFKTFAVEINTFHELFKTKLEERIDEVVLKHTIYETFDNVDILATHHSIEECNLSSYTITEINSWNISIEATGSLKARLQYGSDGDVANGYGAQMHTLFPFDCNLQIVINENFAKSEYEVLEFNVNTDDWNK